MGDLFDEIIEFIVPIGMFILVVVGVTVVGFLPINYSGNETNSTINNTNISVEVVVMENCTTLTEYTYDCADWKDDVCVYKDSEFYGCNIITKCCVGEKDE